MNLRFIKKGIVLTTLATALLIPVGHTHAAERVLSLPQQNNKNEMSRTVLMTTVSEVQTGSAAFAFAGICQFCHQFRQKRS